MKLRSFLFNRDCNIFLITTVTLVCRILRCLCICCVMFAISAIAMVFRHWPVVSVNVILRSCRAILHTFSSQSVLTWVLVILWVP